MNHWVNKQDRQLLPHIPDDVQPVYWTDYTYLSLSHIPHDQSRSRRDEELNQIFIMLDTETSKSHPDNLLSVDPKTRLRTWEDNPNYVVKWSIAGNAAGHNYFLIWGSKPTDAVTALSMIHASMGGNLTRVYVHNLSYDWVFLRKFIMNAWGEPAAMLCTKPHYPISIRFGVGIELRDSLILSQVGLERWARDLDVPHQKAVGSWDYDKIRHQSDELTPDELTYICNDVLAGVECLAALRTQLGCTYRAYPLTATSISRTAAREAGTPYKAHDKYVNSMGPYSWYTIMTKVFHGGYTHGNRHYLGHLIKYEDDGELVRPFDFASSYPFQMLAHKFPSGKFGSTGEDKITPARMLWYAREEAVVGLFCAHDIRLRDPDDPWPVLQVAKVETAVDMIADNGRILEASYVQIWLTDVDMLDVVAKYTWPDDQAWVLHSMSAPKDYLPRWFTDYVYSCFQSKTMLKGEDPVAYALAKARANSNYGMTVQAVIKEDIYEDYETGEHKIKELSPEDLEEKYDNEIHKYTKFLPYSIGVWVTAYAMHAVLRLASCCGEPYYIDTDSCYGKQWDMAALEAYNTECRTLLLERGYGAVEKNGRPYWLGVAEPDGEYIAMRYWGAKRYAVQDKEGNIKITVAGVPKKAGARCVKRLEDFEPGFVFKGEDTGKTLHSYRFAEEITVNEFGDEIGDSIDLTPCDYKLDRAFLGRLDDILMYDTLEVMDFESEAN